MKLKNFKEITCTYLETEITFLYLEDEAVFVPQDLDNFIECCDLFDVDENVEDEVEFLLTEYRNSSNLDWVEVVLQDTEENVWERRWLPVIDSVSRTLH